MWDEKRGRSRQFMWYFRFIADDRESRLLAIYASITLLYSIIQAAFAMGSKSACMFLATACGFYSFVSMAISLSASLFSARKPTQAFSYGFDRMEILLSFSSVTLLLFAAFSVTVESLQHIVITHHEMEPDYLSLVSLFNIVLIASGSLYFNKNAQQLKNASFSVSVGNSALSNNVIVDSIPSAIVILSCFAHNQKLVAHADQLFSIASALLLFVLHSPTLSNTSKVLLQTSPLNAKPAIDRCLRDISKVNGVVEVRGFHCWQMRDGMVVGTAWLAVDDSADTQRVLSAVHSIADPVMTKFTVQIEKVSWDRKSFGVTLNFNNLAEIHQESSGHGHSCGGGHSHSHAHDHGHSHGHSCGGHSHNHSHHAGHSHSCSGHNHSHSHSHDHLELSHPSQGRAQPHIQHSHSQSELLPSPHSHVHPHSMPMMSGDLHQHHEGCSHSHDHSSHHHEEHHHHEGCSHSHSHHEEPTLSVHAHSFDNQPPPVAAGFFSFSNGGGQEHKDD